MENPHDVVTPAQKFAKFVTNLAEEDLEILYDFPPNVWMMLPLDKFKKIQNDKTHEWHHITPTVHYHISGDMYVYNNDTMKVDDNKNNIKQTKPTLRPKSKHKPGWIYLLQLREYVESETNIYKIGRTAQKNMKRFNGYPKSSILHYMVPSKDTVKDERNLISIFDNNFTKMPSVGREYYKGDVEEMINLIEDYLSQEDYTDTDTDNDIVAETHITCKGVDLYDVGDNLLDSFMNYIRDLKPEWFNRSISVPKKLLTDMFNEKYDKDMTVRKFISVLRNYCKIKNINIGENSYYGIYPEYDNKKKMYKCVTFDS